MQVPAHIHALGPGLRDGPQVAFEIADAFVVVLGRDAVLGDVQGKPDLAARCSICRRPSGYTAQPICVTGTSRGGVAKSVGDAGSTQLLR